MRRGLLRKIHPLTGFMVILFFVLELIIAVKGGGRGLMVPSDISLIQTLACFPCGVLGFAFYPSSLWGYCLFYCACGLNFLAIDKLLKRWRSAKETDKIEQGVDLNT